MKLPESSKFQNWVVENETTGLTRDERGWHGFRARSDAEFHPIAHATPTAAAVLSKLTRSLSSQPRRSNKAPSTLSTIVPKTPAITITAASRGVTSKENIAAAATVAAPTTAAIVPKRLMPPSVPGGTALKVVTRRRFAGEGHADLAGPGIRGGLSQRSQRQHGPSCGRDGNNERRDPEIGHGLGGGASAGRLSGAELLLARVSNPGGNQSDGKDHQQPQKHAQVADRHDEGHGRAGERAADIDASGKPCQHGEPAGDGQRREKATAGRRKFGVVQELKDGQDHRRKAERKEVRVPE